MGYIEIFFSILAGIIIFASIVSGVYVVSLQIIAWHKQLKKEPEKHQCPSLYNAHYSKRGMVTFRCELKESHHGPHTAKEDGYARCHWT